MDVAVQDHIATILESLGGYTDDARNLIDLVCFGPAAGSNLSNSAPDHYYNRFSTPYHGPPMNQ